MPSEWDDNASGMMSLGYDAESEAKRHRDEVRRLKDALNAAKQDNEALRKELVSQGALRQSDTAPTVLRDLVRHLRYKPEWEFRLDGAWPALALVIIVGAPDSRREGALWISHYFPVPVGTTYNRKTWRRWVFDCCMKVEAHELGEWFLDGDERPFAPLHGPGEDPYTVHEFRDVVDARTNQKGKVE